MAFNPAAENFRFLGFAGWDGCACCFFCAAHLALCAAAILARPALLIVRRFCGPAGSVPVAAAAVAFAPPGPRRPSCALISAIFAEIFSTSLWSPTMAISRMVLSTLGCACLGI